MFSNQVRKYLEGKGIVNVRSVRGSVYKVELSGTQVLLHDSPSLLPIDIDIFDYVEDIMSRGIHKRGCARSRVGDPQNDRKTIMGNLGYGYYKKRTGESMFDASCYIFAILIASGCVVKKGWDYYKK